MAKKKTKNHTHRNAAPRAPRASKPDDETPLRRLAFTAAGAGGTALAGSFLVHEGWAPKTISTALTAVGAGLAWKGDSSTVRNVGAGVMSAAGSQLALMMMDDRGKASVPPATAQKKPANAGELPPGSLENAFERAKGRLATTTGEEAYPA
jgi:hypothetical protein